MPTCDSKLAAGFVRQCGLRPKQGIRNKWYFNWDDVDREASTVVNKGTKVTVLTLVAGAKIYKAEGNNRTSSASHALSVLDFGNGYIHTDNFTVLYKGEKERERIQELVDGGRVGTIVEKVDTGANGELTYEILGFESGMVITNDDWNSSENSGTTSIVVATQEGEEEATGAKLLLMPAATEATDLAETKAWIAANEHVPA